jgi:hypothetical protein
MPRTRDGKQVPWRTCADCDADCWGKRCKDCRNAHIRGVSLNAGAANPAYKHGRYADGGVGKRNLKRFPLPATCNRCSDRPTLWHHKDRDRSNNDLSNLEALCRACHGREHHDGLRLAS